MSDKRNGSVSRDEKAHSPKNRPARVKLGVGTKMSVPACYKKEGFHQYWFIDRPGEIEKAQAAWYEFVLDDSSNKITTPGGNGETHFLMEIDIETHEADIKEQQDLNNKTTNAAMKIKDGEYSPGKHNASVTRDI